jgi:hypothetical protein
VAAAGRPDRGGAGRCRLVGSGAGPVERGHRGAAAGQRGLDHPADRNQPAARGPQANSRIIDAVGQRLGLDPARVIDVVGTYANTSAGSLPIALAAAQRDGRLRDGDRALLAAFRRRPGLGRRRRHLGPARLTLIGPGVVSGWNRGCPRSPRGARRGSLESRHQPPRPERKPITMLAIIFLVVGAIVALAILSAFVHILFSPWLLLVAVGLLVWVKFGSRRSRR